MNELNDPIPENTEESSTPSQYFGTTQDVVDRLSHCPFCGSHLHLNHLTDFSKNLTQETARCPECSIKVRDVIHRLQ